MGDAGAVGVFGDANELGIPKGGAIPVGVGALLSEPKECSVMAEAWPLSV